MAETGGNRLMARVAPIASPVRPNGLVTAARRFVIVGAVAAWLVVFVYLDDAARWFTTHVLRLDIDSALGESVSFFLYDVPKILLLLATMTFGIGYLRSYFGPERARRLLGARREGVGNVMAAGVGVVTPFCSCSAVPLFIGFVEAGVPLGVTFSYLTAAPLVNEVALVLLFALFGWQIALLYLASGLTIAIVSGVVIGRLGMERYVEGFVWELQVADIPDHVPTRAERVARAKESMRQIVSKVWLFVVAGIAVGAAIHGYVPQEALSGLLGESSWWSVPGAVLLGLPLYSGAAGMIPIVEALIDKGAALGTVLAFMMAVVGLSLPEMIILRRVLKPRLLVVFAGTLALAITLTGFLFNLVA